MEADERYGRDMKPEWICSRCGHRNAVNNEVCMGAEMGDGRCGKPKPELKPPIKARCIEKNCKDCKHYSYHLQKDWCGRENMFCDNARNVKSLAQYLAKHIECGAKYVSDYNSLYKLLEQALDAYESTEGVRINFIKTKEKA